jgi:hypothetical protein
MSEPDSDSALLTPSQRKVLRGTDEISERGRRSSRARARKRARIALLEDIPLLLEAIAPEDLFDTYVFSDTSDRADDLNRINRNTLFDSLRSTVAFAYRIADASGLDAQRVIEEGIEIARTGREEMLLKKFRENPEEMTLGEIEMLAQQGHITHEEHIEAMGLPDTFFRDADTDDDDQDSADGDEE